MVVSILGKDDNHEEHYIQNNVDERLENYYDDKHLDDLYNTPKDLTQYNNSLNKGLEKTEANDYAYIDKEIEKVKEIKQKIKNGESVNCDTFCCPECYQQLTMLYQNGNEDVLIIFNPIDSQIYVAKDSYTFSNNKQLMLDLINNPDEVLDESITGVLVSESEKCKCLKCGKETPGLQWYLYMVRNYQPYTHCCPVCGGEVVVVQTNGNKCILKCESCGYMPTQHKFYEKSDKDEHKEC